jgi:protein phosphatase
MGATIAALVLVGDQALIMHVGDSRVYVESDRFLRPATSDHAGPGGRLTRSLGGRERYEPVSADVVVEPVAGRRFLLATDGLFGHVTEDDLDRCLVDDDVATVEALMRLALEAGGPDNVTIALARTWEDTDGAADPAVEAT